MHKLGRKVFQIILAGLLIFMTPVSAQPMQDDSTRSDPLSFFEPFMGAWLPYPEWEAMQNVPMLRALVPLNFEWHQSGKAIHFAEGLPDRGELGTTGIIVWNTATQKAEFLAYQPDNDLVFKGYYESFGKNAMRRVYDVIDKGKIRKFRETFELREPDYADWTTERLQDGVWTSIGGKPGPEFHIVRPPDEPSDNLLALERLIGEWRPDPDRMPAPMREWRKKNNVTDDYVSFRWGTGKRWIEFGEHRKSNGKWRLEGSGLIAWHAGKRAIVYREHSDSGVSLEGVIEIVDDVTFRRQYRAFAPNSGAQRWLGTWRWDNVEDSCFEWTTARINRNDEVSWPSYWVCKKS